MGLHSTAVAGAALAAILLAGCGGEPTAIAGQATPAALDGEGWAAQSAEGVAVAVAAGAILQPEDLEAAVAARDAAAAPEPAEPEAEALPPELARVLSSGPGGTPLERLEALDLAMEEGSDALPLVLGSTSIVDDALGQVELPDPAAAADPELDPLR